ncbi:MAG: DUF2961 domain-containing protein [Sedimentisphaerales bacterium]|nr:DUF2961 domain-containing protein [Sedimentisphaerales bacterium]
MKRFYIHGIWAVIPCSVIVFLSTPLKANNLNDVAKIKSLASNRAGTHDPAGNADSLNSFPPGQTHIMLDIDGPGQINHIWMTYAAFAGHRTLLRDLVIRMFWENSETPAVEIPLGDFFALGHSRNYKVNSAPIIVGDNTRALNCYWPMPFYKHARIEIYNAGQRGIRRIFYNIDYEPGSIDTDQGLFHAVFHRNKNLPGQNRFRFEPDKNYVILETQGQGQYVGCVLNVDSDADGWWGEGDEIIYIDDHNQPRISGTGSEDYFCNAWGFKNTFSYAYYGVPLIEKLDNGRQLTTAYRWHIPDPVRFNQYIRVTLEPIFPENVTNDYSSAAFWYQREPITTREPLPADNQARFNLPAKNTTGRYSMDGTELEPELRRRGLKVLAKMTPTNEMDIPREGYLRIEPEGKILAIPLPVDEDGRYNIKLQPCLTFENAADRFMLGTDKNDLTAYDKPDNAYDAPFLSVGQAESQNGFLTIYLRTDAPFGIDALRWQKITSNTD